MIKSDQRTKSAAIGVNRRDVIAAAGAAVGLVALAGAAKVAPATPLVRPPGGQDPVRFLSLCLKCDRCRTVCHTGVIREAHFGEGFINWRTPVMDFHAADCDYCRDCIDVCPTGALTDFFGRTTVIGIAQVNESCIAFRTGGCTKCYDECPYLAITLDDKNCPVVDESVCCGCGVCEKVCPALVLQASTGTSHERGIVVKPMKKGDAR